MYNDYNISVVMSFLDNILTKVMTKMEAEADFNHCDPSYELLDETVDDLREFSFMRCLDDCLDDHLFISLLYIGAKSASNCLKLEDGSNDKFISELETRLKRLAIHGDEEGIANFWETCNEKIRLLTTFELQ